MSDAPEVSAAIADLGARARGTRQAAVRLLLAWPDPAVEDELLEAFHQDSANLWCQGNAARVLVERDRDRDPQFLFDGFWDAAFVEQTRLGRTLRLLGADDPALVHSEYGFTRLTALRPVALYAEALSAGHRMVRFRAAMALGDTGDPAAVTPLITALEDPAPPVRSAAAEAVRRLWATTGGLGPHGLGPAFPALVEAMHDPKYRVRRMAARALARAGELDVVRTHLTRRRDRDELRSIESGDLEPLMPTWDGEPPA